MSTFHPARHALGLATLLLVTPAAKANQLGITFTEVPLAQTRSAHASFYFSAPGASTYVCALDGDVFRSCQSPHTLHGLPSGTHRLQIRASDPSGAVGPVAEVIWDQLDPFAGAHPDLTATTQRPSPVAPNSWRGILRINCDLSHAAYEDPIVYPGAALRAHLHKFYGLLGAGPDTSIAALYRTAGDADGKVSSCQGNDLNRSSYWAPALLAPTYDDLGARQADTNDDPAFDVVPAVVGNDDVAHEVFYYSAGVDDLDSIQPIPQGLVMIAGDMRATPEAPQSFSIARWHCQTWESSDAGNPRFSATIPECVEPDRLRADIFFPSCWNGVDLDSADHKSHLAYPVSENGRDVCPASHPVPIVRVSYHYAFPVKPEHSDPATRSSRGWQLASDMYVVSSERPGGASLHGDWMNGWHPDVMQAIVDVCIRGGLDCHDGNLGNGFRLSGTTAGSGAVPDVIFEGMGPAHTGLPSLSVADVTLTPLASGGVASFELRLSQPMSSGVSVRVRTQDITAKAGVDYEPLADSLVTIAAGQTSARVDVPLLSQPDAIRRQFALWIDAADQVLVADGYAVGELNAGSYSASTPRLSVHGGSTREGDAGNAALPFTLSLSEPAGAGGVTLLASTFTSDEIGGVATPGIDYSPVSLKAVHIEEGHVEASVVIKVHGDRWQELDEAVHLRVESVTGAEVANASGTGYIRDDDSAHRAHPRLD